MDKSEFLLEDYKMKVDFFTKHFSRVWMRFNFFLALEGAISIFGMNIFLDNKLDVSNSEIVAFILVNIFICLIWYIFGAQDRYLTILYRNQAHQSGKACADELSLENYQAVGVTQGTPINVTPKHSLIQWRSNIFSMTRLPAVVPIVFFTCWVLVLFFNIKHVLQGM